MKNDKIQRQSHDKTVYKAKPIQRGFKYWCCNDSKTGYLYQFDIYVGKKTASPELGPSERVVMKLTESLKDSHCRIFFANFLTSPQLVYRLMKERKIYFCGPVRAHRQVLLKGMKSTKDLKKRKMDSRYYDGMSVMKWLDTKSVMMISTTNNGNPTNTVNVKRNNKCTKGIDRFDQRTTVYAFDRKSLGKYYSRPF